MTLLCSNGHTNPADSRFCCICGQALVAPKRSADKLLGQRYHIERELGQGGFGRAYLALDTYRFNEPCVLKEFAPLVQGDQALKKAQELFEREAGVLYELQHPQIPKFREMFRAVDGESDRLFLVQDYVDGRTYRSLMNARRDEGRYFSELEVLQLMTQLLPVLDYIHKLGVIHRDIAPDNLMLRFDDQLPVLIDFGGVKQVAAIASQYYNPNHPVPALTRLGKVGYAPHEQMERGTASPDSDLHALAVTMLVLMTGEEPQDLFQGSVPWTSKVDLSPHLTQIFQRMLSPRPSDRYPSAQAVLQALQSTLSGGTSGYITQPPAPTAAPSPSPGATATPTYAATYAAPTYAASPATARKSGAGIWVWLLLIPVILGAGTGGWWLANRLLLPVDDPSSPGVGAVDETEPEVSSTLPPEEQARQAALGERRRQLGVDYALLVNLTNQTFFDRYPEQRGQTLSDSPEDADWRSRWTAIASEWLDQLETHLSPAARQRLGQFTAADRDRWRQRVNEQFVSSRALNDLTDARFFHLWPDQQGQDFLETPMGQVWQAIAFDYVDAIEQGAVLDEIVLEAGRFSIDLSDRLEPGDGQIYIANLGEEQLLRLSLQAPSNSTLLSLYLPRPTPEQPVLLEDAPDTVWAGQLPQTGYYEVVVVSRHGEPLNYRLSLAVDNISTTPIETPDPDEEPPKN
ncbi:MAG: serine/threonine protein kinase [Leptolyngbya sp. DLM2.Bin15]|nr:MAG: serine/threonine protein kinase [Leptolyngbya sp. DLM2.Bin15]